MYREHQNATLHQKYSTPKLINSSIISWVAQHSSAHVLYPPPPNKHTLIFTLVVQYTDFVVLGNPFVYVNARSIWIYPLIQFFTNTQNWQKWQCWHHRLYYMKEKNSATKCYPTKHGTHYLSHSGLMLSFLSHWGNCYLGLSLICLFFLHHFNRAGPHMRS